MQQKSSRIAVIDIGTNTCILLIAELVDGKLVTIHEAFETPRLGESLQNTGEISKDAVERVSKTLKHYAALARKFNSDRIFAFGTYSLRAASNNMKVADELSDKIDTQVEIISGEMEARCSFYGATYDLPQLHDYAVVDVGGGSTEFGYMFDDLFYYKSLNIGSVTLRDQLFQDGKFPKSKIDEAVAIVNEEFLKINFLNLYNKKLVGVAGTPTSLYALHHKMKKFDEKLIHKKNLEVHHIFGLINMLVKKDVLQIRSMGDYMRGRADIIIPGGLILLEFMNYFGFEDIKISTKGLRYGVFLYLINR